MKRKKSEKITEKKKFHFVCVKCRIGIEVEAGDLEEARKKAQLMHDAYQKATDDLCRSHVLQHRRK